jgi:transcriptional antiterminator RfaH
MKQWYAIYTKPRAEKMVAAFLQNRGVETFLPEGCLTSNALSTSSGQEILFPCYLFVNMSLHREGVSFLQWVPGVRSIVSFDGLPTVIPETIINDIKRTLKHLPETACWESTNPLQPGMAVRIVSGPFYDMLATVDRPLSSGERVQVLLYVLGRLNRVQIDKQVLELVPAHEGELAKKRLPRRPRRTRGRGRYIAAK